MSDQTREQLLHQIISALFEIAPAGNLKNSLWARYQELTAEPATYKTPIPICSDCGSPLNDDGTCPCCDDRDLADPDEHSLDESVGEAMHLFTQALTQEPQEPTLVKCPYCSGSHLKYLIDLCPLNPTRPR